jgi:hypothetical protein
MGFDYFYGFMGGESARRYDGEVHGSVLSFQGPFIEERLHGLFHEERAPGVALLELDPLLRGGTPDEG